MSHMTWKIVNDNDWNTDKKERVLFWVNGVLFAMMGFLAGLLLLVLVKTDRSFLFCFSGYPLIFSIPYTFLYIHRHPFLK